MCTTKKNDMLHITFTDTGVGIPEENRNNLFIGFEEGNPVTKDSMVGQGLGLSIAYKLARAMNGELKLSWTEVDKGSSFELVLPIGVVSLVALPEKGTQYDICGYNSDSLEINHKATACNDLSPGFYTILLVDDEPVNLHILKEALKKNKYHFITAHNGEQALSFLQNHREISMILLDVMLPDLSGYAVCRKIREKWSFYELPIILLTVRSISEEIQEGLAAGANDFITKPFDSNELNARVQTHYELKQSVRKAIDMEILFLQSQIKPHFIFNALSVISSLSIREPERAKELVLDLSDYLRGCFDFESTEGLTTIKKELELVRAYLAIEQARFKHRLAVEFMIQEDVECTIPMLSIQPLVENAVKHGIMPLIEGGKITVSVRAVGDFVKILVSDNGVGIDSEKIVRLLSGESKKGSVGLRNIHTRLIKLYGIGLKITEEPMNGTTVEFVIPLRYKEAKLS